MSVLSVTCCLVVILFFLFFFNDTATTEIYTLSLHDALPIWDNRDRPLLDRQHRRDRTPDVDPAVVARSEEHTSELQSRGHLVCRLLLEKKKTEPSPHTTRTSILESILPPKLTSNKY